MFRVCCPATVLWHPAVHHSLLVLRALQQRHTLVLDDVHDKSSVPTSRLPLRLLGDAAMHIRIVYEHAGATTAADKATATTTSPQPCAPSSPVVEAQRCCVYAPEHILHLCPASARSATLSPSVRGHMCALDDACAAYLETSMICTHVLHAVDALLVALASDNMDVTRLTHAWLMDMLARLDQSLPPHDTTTVDGSASCCGSSSQQCSDGDATSVIDAQPLSTWPLFATLQFLIEEGGLLGSAFPRVLRAYTTLTQQSSAVRFHRRLVQQTLQQQQQQQRSSHSPLGHSATLPRVHAHGEGSYMPGAAGAVASTMATDTSAAAACGAHPQRLFLHDVQRRLHAYTSSTPERAAVYGIAGLHATSDVRQEQQLQHEAQPLASRHGVSGGRLGLQTVPARLPWPLQNTPLYRR